MDSSKSKIRVPDSLGAYSPLVYYVLKKVDDPTKESCQMSRGLAVSDLIINRNNPVGQLEEQVHLRMFSVEIRRGGFQNINHSPATYNINRTIFLIYKVQLQSLNIVPQYKSAFEQKEE
jgi:hypothetical protein